MKKLFFGMLAIVAMIATSCQQEADLGVKGNGEIVSVSFELGTQASRAYSDGKQADHLQWAVYTEDGTLLGDLGGEDDQFNGSKTIRLDLATGDTYHLLFWAQNAEAKNAEAPYKLDVNTKTVTVDYTNAVSNNEKYDAFYAYKTIEVTGATTVSVELKRPFAQLNIGTNDYEEMAKAGRVIKKSSVTVPVYSTLNLATGAVEGEQEVTFAYADVPTGEIPVAGYQYVAMNYLLVGKDQSVVDVKFSYATADDSYEQIRTVGSVPVQRNYRTNIYGKIFTSATDVNVETNPEYDGTLETGLLAMDQVQLQQLLNEAGEGVTNITLGRDIVGDVVDVQKANRQIVINGGKHTYNGTIKVHSNSNFHADASLTLQNINFVTNKAEENFVEALENGSERYSCNITVENCTFKAGVTRSTEYPSVVGVQVKASKNVVVKNCTATNMHSLIQATSCDESVTVENATIRDCKNGVAFKQVKAATVKGSTINVEAYGIRFDGNTDNYGITVEGNTVTAAQPFIVRKMTGEGVTITMVGENNLTSTTGGHTVIITKGSDDAEYEEPEVEYTLGGAEDYMVYPRDIFVNTWEEFTAALAANTANIVLANDITYDANYQLQKAVSLDLNGKSLTLPMINIHTKSTVKNGTISGKVYARKNAEIVFDNVKFSGAVSDNLSTEGHLAIQGGCKSLYAKDCLFSPTSVSGSQTKPLSFEGGSTIMKFENCEFKSSPYKKQVYFNSLSAAGSLEFVNCNFNNKTPNIMFAAACPLTNITMSGTTKLGSVTFEINRAKEVVTEAEWAHIDALIANNSFSSVRLFYAGGSSEYIR